MNNQQNHEQVVEQLPGEERGIPSVNDSQPSAAKRGLIVLVLLLIVGVAGGIASWKFKKNAAIASDTSTPKSLQVTSAVPARSFVLPPQAPPPPPPAAPVSSVPVIPSPSASAPVSSSRIVPAPVPTHQARTTTVSGKAAPVLDKASASLMAPINKSASGIEGTDPGKQFNTNDSGGFAEMLSSTRTGTRAAEMLGNRNFILAKGSFIDCVLQTKLDSTLPGMTACVISRNIYSDNGKVLLLERGSVVTGEYASNMKQGSARIFVLWNRIKTPLGVIINLDSPGTDPLGGGGVPGHIDTHFWQRFGGALMLSLVDDIARGVTSNSSSSGNNQFNFNSTGDATQNMAAEVLKTTINIPPTLYKNQGEQVGIYIARDLDFSSVYDVTIQ